MTISAGLSVLSRQNAGVGTRISSLNSSLLKYLEQNNCTESGKKYESIMLLPGSKRGFFILWHIGNTTNEN
jgi:hypothetical protein